MKFTVETLCLSEVIPGLYQDFLNLLADDFEFASLQEIIEANQTHKIVLESKDILMFIIYVPELQTSEALDAYKKLNPSAEEIGLLLQGAEKLRTKEVLEYFISLYPDEFDVARVLGFCEKFRTREMWKYFFDLKPCLRSLAFLYTLCPDVVKAYKKYLKENEK